MLLLSHHEEFSIAYVYLYNHEQSYSDKLFFIIYNHIIYFVFGKLILVPYVVLLGIHRCIHPS